MIINAMNVVQDEATTVYSIGAHFKEPALAYKLVRMANVAPLGVRGIHSVEQAVSVVGRAAIFRWLALLLTASFEGTSGIKHELLREALVRARHCELLAYPAGSSSPVISSSSDSSRVSKRCWVCRAR